MTDIPPEVRAQVLEEEAAKLHGQRVKTSTLHTQKELNLAWRGVYTVTEWLRARAREIRDGKG